MDRVLTIFAAFAVILLASSMAWTQQPGNLILQVPDWNQPSSYGVVGYPNWCSPTAGANLFGYWEDVKGKNGLTDRAAFGASPAYPGTVGTWEQGLYHDGMIELGWFMNTGNWQNQGPPPSFPPNAGSTPASNILSGLLAYAATSWIDNDYPVAGGGTGIVKTAYDASGFTDNVGSVGLSQMWAAYCSEIDAARPAEVTFNKWVNSTQLLGTMTISGFEAYTLEQYLWDDFTQEHSVVGVGYVDITAGFQNNGQDEWFVVQDGWGTTGQYVAVPLDGVWFQNDYISSITAIPEPSTLALLVFGTLGLLVLGWRNRRT